MFLSVIMPQIICIQRKTRNCTNNNFSLDDIYEENRNKTHVMKAKCSTTTNIDTDVAGFILDID